MKTQKQKQKKFENQDFHTPKIAFDEVIAYYSELPETMHAQDYGAASGGSRNPASPSVSDFKCDVEEQIQKVVKSSKHLTEFIIRYKIGLERLSKDDQKVFNRYEQKLGRLFIKTGLYPLRKYFISIREKR